MASPVDQDLSSAAPGRDDALAQRVTAQVMASLQPFLDRLSSQQVPVSQPPAATITSQPSASLARSQILDQVPNTLPEDIFGSPDKDATPSLDLHRFVSSPRKRLLDEMEDDEDDGDFSSPEDQDASGGEGAEHTPLLLPEKVRLVREELASLLPEERPPPPKRPKPGMLSRLVEGQDASPEVSQLPLSETVRSHLALRRDETRSLQPGKFPRRPKAKPSAYLTTAPDFALVPSVLPPTFAHYASGKKAPLQLSPDLMTALQSAQRLSLLQGSFAEWMALAIFRILGRTVSDLETEELSNQETVERLRSVIDLSSSLSRAIEDRVSQDSFALWVTELTRRDSELAAVTFLDDEARRELRSAPMCCASASESLTDTSQGTLFSGREALLGDLQKRVREDRRDQVLFRIPKIAQPASTRSVAKQPPKRKPQARALSSKPGSKKQPFRDPPGLGKAAPNKRWGKPGSGKKSASSTGKREYRSPFGSFPFSGRAVHTGVALKRVNFRLRRLRSRSSLKILLDSLARSGRKPVGSAHPEERVCVQVQNPSPTITCSVTVQPTFISHEAHSIRRRDQENDKQGGDRTRRSHDSGILQQSLCGPKGHRGLEAGHRSLSPQPFSASTQVLNGDSGVHQAINARGFVGCVFGSQGRLLPFSYPPKAQEVPSLLLSGKDVAVQSPSLRPVPCTVGFLHGGEGTAGSGSSSRYFSSSVPGRLGHSSRFEAHSGDSERFRDLSLPEDGVHYQLREVGVDTNKGLCVRGLSLPHGGRDGDSLGRKDQKDQSQSRSFLEGPLPTRETLAVAPGSSFLHGKAGPHGQITYEGASVQPQVPVVPSYGFSYGPCPDIAGISASSEVVGLKRFPSQGFHVSPPLSLQAPLYGCFSRGLGSTPGFPGALRPMVLQRGQVAYQPSRDGGSFSGTPSLGVPVHGRGGLSGYRQFDSGLLYQQAGRHTVPLVVSPSCRYPDMVQCQEYPVVSQAHSGSPECSGRFSIQGRTDPPGGVVPVSQDFPVAVRSVGFPSCGSVCHSLEQQGSYFRVPHSRREGFSSGCPVDVMAGSGGLCLPPSGDLDKGAPEDSHPSMSSDSHSSSVAGQAMVPRVVRLAGRLPSRTSTQVRPPEAAQDGCVSSASSGPQASRLEVVEQSLCQKGFSQEVSIRVARPSRQSSLAVYQSKWSVFQSWCNRRKIDPFASPSAVVADFLLEKFKAGLACSTLAGYRTAIAKTLLPRTGVDLGADADLSALLRNFQVERPVSRNSVPDWDLSLVLNKLSAPPFEPLEDAPLKLLTWKTVFLVALASGKRRSEIHALDGGRVSWREDFSVVKLRVIPSFLAKTQLATSPPLSFSVPALAPSLGPDMDQDLLLCPVRALRSYLDRTKKLRKGRKLLFLSYKKGFKSDICSATISFWIKKCIRTCYDLADLPSGTSFKVRAHDVRALAASLAYLGRTPLERVLEACTWSSPNTFTSFYLRDLEWCESSGRRLEVIAAQQQVRP